MAKGAFNTLYRKLNAQQKRAVDAIEGPVMVIAGPGTGKTQILTLRIANILRLTDTPPEAILALTFTESAAATCRRRLVDIVGTPGYRVQIHTFHSYANEVIRRFPDAFPRIVGSRSLSSVERIAILQRLVDKTALNILRPFGNTYFYVSAIAQKISELKREHITPDDFATLVQQRLEAFRAIPDLYHVKGVHKGSMRGKYVQLQKRLHRDEELLILYRAYEAALAKEHVYDYEDMLLEVIRALRNDPELLLTLQEEAQYVLADEHQDVNESQNQLLDLLVSFHDHPNIFVVGDEKQAIFRFQGASLDNFLFFKKRFPDAILIALTANYRSVQSILDTAHALISYTPAGMGKHQALLSKHAGTAAEAVEVYACDRPQDECLFVAKDIKQKLAEGVDPRDIAVIYRVNRDAEAVLSALVSEGVPSMVASEQNALANLSIKKLLSILSAIVLYGKDDALIPVLHIDFLHLNTLDVARFIYHRKRDLFGALANAPLLRNMGIQEIEPFIALGKKLHRWKRLAHNEGLLKTLNAVAEESGFIAALLTSSYPEEKLAYMRAVFAEAALLCRNDRHASLESFLKHVALLEEYNLSLSIPMSSGDRPAVRLMTAHRAKGQEFAYVYIIHANDGHWGNRHEHLLFSPLQSTTAENDTDDERRLFYVALTRAKQHIVITYAQESETGTQFLPTQFIQEMNLSTAAQYVPIARPSLPETKPISSEYLDRAFVQELFFKQGLSATAVNNYLECPWRYFYRNLLRVPEAPEKELEYGTAVHAALYQFFEQWKEGINPGTRGLIRLFTRALRTTLLPASILPTIEEKGKRALRTYYQQGHARWNRSIFNEYSLTVLLPMTDMGTLPNLRLRGDIDKISITPEGAVYIHDYKTGKPKTRGQIFGKEDVLLWGPYKRQLIFYKVLLDYSATSRTPFGPAEEGIIEFIEPDEQNRSISVSVPLSIEDSQALLQLLQDIAQEIIDLSFMEKGCNKKDCRYCALRTFITPLLG